MRFEDFYSTTSKSKHIKNLHEGNIFQKVTPEAAILMAEVLHRKNKSIPKELEDIIASEPVHAVRYARRVLKGRFPQGEQAILNSAYDTQYISFLKSIGYEDVEESITHQNMSPENAYYKAVDLFHNKNEPIPKELEEIMATDPSYAYFYAIDFIKSRFPQGEEAILNGPYKDNYINFLKSINYQDVEESFKQFFNSNIQESYTPLTSLRAYEWALRLDRHSYKIPKELENEIAKDAKASFKYALHVKRARFEKGEPVIATDPEMSYNYAKHIIKGRFPEGEEVIMRSIQKDAYVRFLREINYSDVEESFVNFFNSTVNESFIPDDPEEAYELAKNYQRSNKQIPEEVEDVIAESPKYSYLYARYILGDKPFPKGEPVISKSYKYSLDYARNVLKGRFPLGEELLSKDPDYAFLYARDVLKGRFPEGEEVIMSLYDTKRHYIKFLKSINYEDVEESAFTKGTLMDILNVVRGLIHKNLPVPDKMINAIASDAFTSHIYARDVIEKPFPEGESTIAKDGYWSYYYARDVIHGRFPEGEPAIFRSMFKDDYLDYLKEIKYQDVEESFERFFTEAKRKVRPPTEEELTDPYAAAEYAENVLKGRFPEGEPVIIKTGIVSIEYARDVIGGRWPEFENRLVNNPNDYDYDEEVGDVIMGYIGEVIQGRWPEIEPFIFSNDYLKREYTDYLKSMNYQDVEESFEQFFTEAKGKVRKPNKLERTNPLSAAIYASEVVQGRVPELEPLILTEPTAIAQYIWFAIKGRWKEAEETIANIKPSVTTLYALEILKDRWINIPDIPKEIALQAEENIKNSPSAAAIYATDIIKGRWPEGEASILSEPDSKEDYINFLKSINYQDVEESFEQFFTEAKRKVRKPNKEERTDPLSAAIYASDVVQGRVPELESLILTDYAAIAQYIWFAIKGRWKEAEETIANSEPSGTARYAAEILKDRWINIPDIPKEIALQAEENIINDPWIASVYAQEAIKGRWPEAEEIILSEPDSKEDYINFLKSINYQDVEESFEQFFTESKVRKPNKKERTDPELAYYYARDVVKGRVPELEPLILTDNMSMWGYIYHIINGRWPEAEEIIATGDPGEACDYAVNIIKGRWPEGEASILSEPDSKERYIDHLNSINYQDLEESFEHYFTEAKGKVRKPNKEERTDPVSAYYYAKDVVQGRVPELEPLIINSYSPTLAPMYALNVIGGRWPELEKYIIDTINLDLTLSDATIFQTVMYYIYEVVKGRWPEIEPILFHYDEFKEEYINFLKSINHSDLEESYKLR